MAGYVESFKPLQRRHPRLSSLVPWRTVADESLGIMRTKADGWLCCLRVECPDQGSLSEEARDVVTLRLNEVYKLLPPGGSVWHHWRRRPAPPKPPGQTGHNPMAALMEEVHLAQINAPGVSWQTEVFVSLACRPPKATKGKGFTKYVLRDPGLGSGRYGVEEFAGDTEQIVGFLTSICGPEQVVRLTRGTLTAYLHSCVSVHDHPLANDYGTVGLHGATADSGFWPGTVPVIGDFATKQYVRSLVLSRQFPSDGTESSIFRGLNRLAEPFDVVTRWIPKPRTEAKKVTDKTQTNWLSMRGRHWLSGDQVKNTFVARQGDDADDARDRVLSGNYTLGRLTMTFLVRVDTPTTKPSREELEVGHQRLRKIAQVVRGAGCSVIDDPINQTENFVATWPGEVFANVDTLELTSLNVATLALSDTPWKGITWNAHLKSPPLLYAMTEGCMPIGVDTCVGDLLDFLMIGPKGSGKSTALAFFDACWLIDAMRHLYHFDVGRSCECVIRCLGGQYHDLFTTGLQVMANLDDEQSVSWIFDWLKRRVHEAGVPKHPDIDTFLWGGLDGPDSLRAQRDRPRTLSEYLHLRQMHANKVAGLASAHGSDRMRELALWTPKILGALRLFAQGGPYGHLTDAPEDRLSLGTVHGFELGRVLKLASAYSAQLEILFFRLQRLRHLGCPTRYVFDEASHVLNTDAWLDILTVDMPAWRRQNTSGGFATQSMSQFKGSRVAPLLKESAQTRFLLPNPEALDDDVRDGYTGLQLGEEEIQRNIVMAKPKDEMYWIIADDRHGRRQRRLISLRLDPLIQAICGANTEPDHEAMDRIVARYPAEEFGVHWLDHRGFGRQSARLVAMLQERACAVPV